MAKATKAGLKYRVTSFVVQAAGGPEVYKGRTMRESHATMNISEQEWAAMLKDFRRTMKKFKIPQAERDELINLLETTRGDIIMR